MPDRAICAHVTPGVLSIWRRMAGLPSCARRHSRTPSPCTGCPLGHGSRRRKPIAAYQVFPEGQRLDRGSEVAGSAPVYPKVLFGVVQAGVAVEEEAPLGAAVETISEKRGSAISGCATTYSSRPPVLFKLTLAGDRAHRDRDAAQSPGRLQSGEPGSAPGAATIRCYALPGP